MPVFPGKRRLWRPSAIAWVLSMGILSSGRPAGIPENEGCGEMFLDFFFEGVNILLP
jgi:hypothetical protein